VSVDSLRAKRKKEKYVHHCVQQCPTNDWPWHKAPSDLIWQMLPLAEGPGWLHVLSSNRLHISGIYRHNAVMPHVLLQSESLVVEMA